MNFLGIGPGEFFFVIILALIVLGPERLPGFARSLGKTIIRLRNWTNASPDAKVLLQLQQELQTEINDIRATLREVSDSVRQDLGAAQNDIMKATTAANTTLNDASAATNVALNDATRTIGAPQVQTEATNTLPDSATPTPAASENIPAAHEPSVETPADAPVARTSKPSWLSPPPPTSDVAPAIPATSTAPDGTVEMTPPTPAAPNAPVAVTSLVDTAPNLSTDSGIYAEIRSLRAEINRLKVTSTSGAGADTVSMLRVDVEQLSRDMKDLRSKISTPAPATAVNSDTIMMLRIELGELNNRIDSIHAELKKNNTNVEPTA